MLELGAGCGLVSAVAAYLGAEVTATDRHEVVQRLKRTAQLGKEAQRFEVAQLDWHTDPPWPSGHFDLIVGSDVTYGSGCHQDLLRVLWHLTAGSKTLVLLTHCVRSPEQTALLWHQISEVWPGLLWVLDYEVLERCHDEHQQEPDLPDKCITFVLSAVSPSSGFLREAYEKFLFESRVRPLERPRPQPVLLSEGVLGPVFMVENSMQILSQFFVSSEDFKLLCCLILITSTQVCTIQNLNIGI